MASRFSVVTAARPRSVGLGVYVGVATMRQGCGNGILLPSAILPPGIQLLPLRLPKLQQPPGLDRLKSWPSFPSVPLYVVNSFTP